MKRYDLERLVEIPIGEVLEELGARPGRSGGGKLWHCFNDDGHAHGDRNPSLAVWQEKNICKCFACGGPSGDPVAVAKFAFGNDFRQACEWLHEKWGIPFVDDESEEPVPRPRMQAKPRPAARRKQEPKTYWALDLSRKRERIRVGEQLQKDGLTEMERMRLAYAYIYRSSLRTDQRQKIEYYRSRGIESPWEEICGFLSWGDMKRVLDEMRQWWRLDELERFNIVKIRKNGSTGSLPGNVITVPSFAPYTDLLDGLMLRSIEPGMKMKERSVSNYEIRPPLPFGMTTEMLKRAKEIWFTEGHLDAFALNRVLGKAFVAFPGTNGWNEKILGSFQGKRIVVAFDQDKAGEQGYEKLLPHLEAVGAEVYRFEWNSEAECAKDLLDLANRNRLSAVYKEWLKGVGGKINAA